MDIENDYYTVKFELIDDLNEVICGGPWLVMGNYLVQKWKPAFQAHQATITNLTVWIRITRLHTKWFDEEIMKRIGNLLGIIHKVDPKTTSHNREKYARLCIELDLQKPLVP